MSKTHFNGETCAHSSYPIACGIPTVNIISSLHYYPIKACGDEIRYSFFNENNKRFSSKDSRNNSESYG